VHETIDLRRAQVEPKERLRRCARCRADAGGGCARKHDAAAKQRAAVEQSITGYGLERRGPAVMAFTHHVLPVAQRRQLTVILS